MYDNLRLGTPWTYWTVYDESPNVWFVLKSPPALGQRFLKVQVSGSGVNLSWYDIWNLATHTGTNPVSIDWNGWGGSGVQRAIVETSSHLILWTDDIFTFVVTTYDPAPNDPYPNEPFVILGMHKINTNPGSSTYGYIHYGTNGTLYDFAETCWVTSTEWSYTETPEMVSGQGSMLLMPLYVTSTDNYRGTLSEIFQLMQSKSSPIITFQLAGKTYKGFPTGYYVTFGTRYLYGWRDYAFFAVSI